MKKILLICIVFVSVFTFSCEEADIPDAPNYDKTEILSFKVYDVNKENVLQGSPVINTETGVISATVDKGTDLAELFAICSLSSGANIYPALGGYQDWSSCSRQFTVTSASGSRSKQWTITLTVAGE